MSEREPDAVLDALARAPAPAVPPLGGDLEAELGKLAPVAPRRPLRQLALLVVLSLVYGAIWIAALSVRDDLGELPIAWVIGVALVWVLGFAASAYFALVPRAGTMMPRWGAAAASAVTASIVLVTLGLVIEVGGPSSVHHGWDKLAHGHGCLELGLASALVPVIAGIVFLRGALPVGSRWIAAALGAAGGCLGGLVLHWHCHVADRMHVGLVHGGVVVIAALLAALLAPRATDRPLL